MDAALTLLALVASYIRTLWCWTRRRVPDPSLQQTNREMKGLDYEDGRYSSGCEYQRKNISRRVQEEKNEVGESILLVQ
jgi:hypothetical protein